MNFLVCFTLHCSQSVITMAELCTYSCEFDFLWETVAAWWHLASCSHLYALHCRMGPHGLGRTLHFSSCVQFSKEFGKKSCWFQCFCSPYFITRVIPFSGCFRWTCVCRFFLQCFWKTISGYRWCRQTLYAESNFSDLVPLLVNNLRQVVHTYVTLSPAN